MGLLGKVFLGKTAADIAGKGIKKAEKKVKRNLKRTKKTIALMVLSFLCGASLMGYFVYAHRRVIAAAVVGTKMPGSPHRFCCGKKLFGRKEA